MDSFTESTTTAIINAPLETINLTEWLFTLKDKEYQECSSSHIAAGNSVSENGRRMSINVEQISGNLLVQHYEENISERDHCAVLSLSDSLSPLGHTTLIIKWELKVQKLSDSSCELSNHVVIALTEHFLHLLTAAGISDLEPIRLGMKDNLEVHNKEETPLFAANIQKKALSGLWN
jgi:hypothetical protein